MNKIYNVYLDDQLIGTTQLEKADAPMGLAYGKIKFIDGSIGYQYLKNYCHSNQIKLACDFPEDNLLATTTIKSLIVKGVSGMEIPAEGNQITGLDNSGFEIFLEGIPYPFYGEEFPHHKKAYDDMIKD